MCLLYSTPTRYFYLLTKDSVTPLLRHLSTVVVWHLSSVKWHSPVCYGLGSSVYPVGEPLSFKSFPDSLSYLYPYELLDQYSLVLPLR